MIAITMSEARRARRVTPLLSVPSVTPMGRISQGAIIRVRFVPTMPNTVIKMSRLAK